MSKIKLTKGELKKQRDSMKQFNRYLPTLQLKKQQLQMKILEAQKVLREKQAILNQQMNHIEKWVGLFADPDTDLKQWVQPQEVKTGKTNIAGDYVPVFEEVVFGPTEYDFYSKPFWVDKAIIEVRKMISAQAEVEVVKRQITVLQKELRTTTQRVNLFEKIKIPECKESIRKIGIYLGDQQANAVGVSKVAKKKVDQKAAVLALS
jgi:V/A-type H+-transporting ATPase subunit D